MPPVPVCFSMNQPLRIAVHRLQENLFESFRICCPEAEPRKKNSGFMSAVWMRR